MRDLSSAVEEALSPTPSFNLAPFQYPEQDDYALLGETMRFVAGLVQVMRPARLIEFGSGHSTVVLGAIAREIGARLLSLDHQSEFARQTRSRVQDSGLAGVVGVEYRRITLHRYGAKVLPFYSIRWEEHRDFEHCEFALVDGPPYYIGREAALYELFPRLSEGALVVVDDMNRELYEQRWLKSWERVFGDSIEVHLLPHIGRGVGVLRKRKNVIPSYKFPQSEIWESWRHSIRVTKRLITTRTKQNIASIPSSLGR